MFGLLKEKFENIIRVIKKTGKIREENIQHALKQIKMALLEADVNYRVVKSFLENVKNKALGEEVLKSVTPFQQFIKIVQDEIVHLINSDHHLPKILPANRLNKIIVCGLNGSGKTTTTLKLAKYFKNNKTLIIAADVYRPAAVEQLIQLGKKNGVDIFSLPEEKNPLKIIKNGIDYAKKNSYNLMICDTAGRMEINKELMNELKKIEDIIKPDYNLLVTDAMTGQLVVDVVSKFKEYINIYGVILSKFDSDIKGGIALSLKFLTGCDICFLGIGEKVKDIELFNAERIAKRILGMGDIVTLVEKTEELLDKKELENINKKIKASEFNFTSFLEQLRTIHNSGLMNNILDHLPVKLPVKNLNLNQKDIKHIEAIIFSMTEIERVNVDIIDLSRKIRIAKGSGRPLDEVTKLIKQFKEMKKTFKKFEKMDRHSLKSHPLFKQFM